MEIKKSRVNKKRIIGEDRKGGRIGINKKRDLFSGEQRRGHEI